MTEIRPMVRETQQNTDKEGDSVSHSPGHDSHLNKGKWKRFLSLWMNLL